VLVRIDRCDYETCPFIAIYVFAVAHVVRVFVTGRDVTGRDTLVIWKTILSKYLT
jgi:hypothetical protein